MKKFIFASVCLFIHSVFAYPDYEQGGYVNIFGGAAFAKREKIDHVKTKLHTGYAAGGSLGYVTPWNFSVEGESTYRRHTIKKVYDHDRHLRARGHFSSLSYMANLICKNPLHFWLEPYLGAGIGYAHSLHTLKSHGKRGFAWQAMGGVAFAIAYHVDFNLEYRYYQPNVEEYHCQNALLGFKFIF